MKKKIAVLIGAVLLFTSSAFASTEAATVYIPVSAATPAPAPAPAIAAEPKTFDWTTPGPVVQLRLGAYGPTDDEKTYDVFNPQTGFAGDLVLGYRFNPYLIGQVEVGYQQSSGEFSGWEYNALPAYAAVHIGFPVEKEFELYVLGGIGAVFYNVEDINESHDEVGMATKLGLGAAFHFGKYSVGAEVAYQMTNISYAPNDAMMAYVTFGYGH